MDLSVNAKCAPFIRSDLDIHLKKDHNPSAAAVDEGGNKVTSSTEEQEEEARPFAGEKVKKAENDNRAVPRRDHKCEQCDYRSSHRSGLTAHVRAVHDKIKDHVCQECDFRYQFNVKNKFRAINWDFLRRFLKQGGARGQITGLG